MRVPYCWHWPWPRGKQTVYPTDPCLITCLAHGQPSGLNGLILHFLGGFFLWESLLAYACQPGMLQSDFIQLKHYHFSKLNRVSLGGKIYSSTRWLNTGHVTAAQRPRFHGYFCFRITLMLSFLKSLKITAHHCAWKDTVLMKIYRERLLFLLLFQFLAQPLKETKSDHICLI